MLNTSYLWLVVFFFFNDTATTEIYTLSLHDALPIYPTQAHPPSRPAAAIWFQPVRQRSALRLDHRAMPPPTLRLIDRKSTRLNSSHANISYAVFCLKKKKTSQAHS